jgi:hypothetical protein
MSMKARALRRLGIVNANFVWNYRGHNRGLFQRGQNWWQITVPASRKRRRCALIVTTIRSRDEA